jgi:ATP-dependent Clp protease adapter protein ClpS
MSTPAIASARVPARASRRRQEAEPPGAQAGHRRGARGAHPHQEAADVQGALHNDDYTTKEFVVFVLQTVFQRSEADALAIMTHVHNQGVGVAGVYTFEIAETKVQKTVQLARARTSIRCSSRSSRASREEDPCCHPTCPPPSSAPSPTPGAAATST